MSQDTPEPGAVVLPFGSDQNHDTPRWDRFTDRVRIYKVPYPMDWGTTLKIHERLWQDTARSMPGSHIEPGALELVSKIQVVTGFADDKEITLGEKLRLYNGEKVVSKRTYKPLNLRDVADRAGQSEGMVGLSSRECMRLVQEVALASQNAARRCGQVIKALQVFSPGPTPLTTEGKAAAATILGTLDTGDDQPLKEWLDHLKAVLHGPNVSLVDCQSALVLSESGQDTFRSCVSILSVGRALYRRVNRREQQFMSQELSPPRKRALQQLFLRACDPKYDENCQKLFELYMGAIHNKVCGIKQREPFPHQAEEVERALRHTGLPLDDFRKMILGTVSHAMHDGPPPKPWHTLHPDLQEAIERVIRQRIQDSFRFASPPGDQDREASILSELVTTHAHCPVCARGVLTQLSEKHFLEP